MMVIDSVVFSLRPKNRRDQVAAQERFTVNLAMFAPCRPFSRHIAIAHRRLGRPKRRGR